MPTSERWHPRGEQTWPEWREAQPGITRVEHVRSGAKGTFLRWPRSQRKRSPGYAVIEWDPLPGAEPGGTWNRRVGRVVAYAWDLKLCGS